MKKLDEILAGKKSVGLAGHVRPDGDCVGSTLGVYNYIRKYYPDVDVRLYLEPIPNIFKFLNFSSEIRSDYEESVVFDLFIAMDCGDEKRLGNAARYFQEAKHTACIDHHVKGSKAPLFINIYNSVYHIIISSQPRQEYARLPLLPVLPRYIRQP